jgi:hypothetical protein
MKWSKPNGWNSVVTLHNSGFGPKPTLVLGQSAIERPGSHETSPLSLLTDRENRVLMPFWTSAQARKQLKYLAIEEESTQQRLLSEALNMLFLSRGKTPMA